MPQPNNSRNRHVQTPGQLSAGKETNASMSSTAKKAIAPPSSSRRQGDRLWMNRSSQVGGGGGGGGAGSFLRVRGAVVGVLEGGVLGVGGLVGDVLVRAIDQSIAEMGFPLLYAKWGNRFSCYWLGHFSGKHHVSSRRAVCFCHLRAECGR